MLWLASRETWGYAEGESESEFETKATGKKQKYKLREKKGKWTRKGKAQEK